MHRALALALLITSCGAPARETRELWRGSVAGIDVVIGLERRRDTDGRTEIVETISTMNARLPAPRHRIPGPPDRALQGELRSVPITVCPIDAGLAFRIGDRPWRVLWVLAGRVLDASPPLEGEDCSDLGVPNRYVWLAANPGGATTCLALDEEGDRLDALECLERAPEADLPIEGAPRVAPSTGDLEALRRRLAADAAR